MRRDGSTESLRICVDCQVPLLHSSFFAFIVKCNNLCVRRLDKFLPAQPEQIYEYHGISKCQLNICPLLHQNADRYSVRARINKKGLYKNTISKKFFSIK
jgi:hypothetical protein